VLTLSGRSQLETKIGQILNLLSSDLTRLQLLVKFLPYLFISPAVFVISSGILWFYLGLFASLLGQASLLLCIPLQCGFNIYNNISYVFKQSPPCPLGKIFFLRIKNKARKIDAQKENIHTRNERAHP
jgi:hypothetical protein